MALKDWEKTIDNTNTGGVVSRIILAWTNKKNDKTLSVEKLNQFVPDNKSKFSVELEDKNLKTFKSKSQAESYARTYMRSH